MLHMDAHYTYTVKLLALNTEVFILNQYILQHFSLLQSSSFLSHVPIQCQVADIRIRNFIPLHLL